VRLRDEHARATPRGASATRKGDADLEARRRTRRPRRAAGAASRRSALAPVDGAIVGSGRCARAKTTVRADGAACAESDGGAGASATTKPNTASARAGSTSET
jgi:hypothetical protein